MKIFREIFVYFVAIIVFSFWQILNLFSKNEE